MKVKSEVIYSLSITGNCQINKKYWVPIKIDNNDTYIYNKIENSIYGNSKSKFRTYELKDEFQQQIKASFNVKNEGVLTNVEFNIEDIFIEYNEILELLLIKIIYSEYQDQDIPTMDCIDYLAVITASKFYENNAIDPNLNESIELIIDSDCFTLLKEEDNYNGIVDFIFTTPVKLENTADNCAFSINCFSGSFFKDIKNCENDCRLLDQEHKDFLYKLIKVRNDEGIKNVSDELLENNGQTSFISERYQENQLYVLNDLNFSLCCEHGDDNEWYVRRFFDNYSRLIYIIIMLKNIFIKY